jgi:hypothetical protein
VPSDDKCKRDVTVATLVSIPRWQGNQAPLLRENNINGGRPRTTRSAITELLRNAITGPDIERAAEQSCEVPEEQKAMRLIAGRWVPNYWTEADIAAQGAPKGLAKFPHASPIRITPKGLAKFARANPIQIIRVDQDGHKTVE